MIHHLIFASLLQGKTCGFVVNRFDGENHFTVSVSVRPNLSKYEYVTTEKKFLHLMFSGHEDVEWLNPLDEDTLAVQYNNLIYADTGKTEDRSEP